MPHLTNDLITFGKHKNKSLDEVLKDRSYCKWLLEPEQDWFMNNYEYLYNQVKNYNPISQFIISKEHTSSDFLDTYDYFNLKSPSELPFELSENDKLCYTYYLSLIDSLKKKIIEVYVYL